MQRKRRLPELVLTMNAGTVKKKRNSDAGNGSTAWKKAGKNQKQQLMLPEYNSANFDEQDLRCNNCGWQGKGWVAVVTDLFGVTTSKEVHCPECDEQIGAISNEGGPSGEGANEANLQTG